jgi:hypothetical protein
MSLCNYESSRHMVPVWRETAQTDSESLPFEVWKRRREASEWKFASRHDTEEAAAADCADKVSCDLWGAFSYQIIHVDA